MSYRFALASDFPHRSNNDGTIHSTCPHCLITVGTSTWEAELEQMEAKHVCSPERLRHFPIEGQKKPPKIENWTPPGKTAAVA